MRRDPTPAELLEHEVVTEAHTLVLEWHESAGAEVRNSRKFSLGAVEDFAAWMLSRRPPPGNALAELAGAPDAKSCPDACGHAGGDPRRH